MDIIKTKNKNITKIPFGNDFKGKEFQYTGM